jgi:hypothetical protein
MTRDVESATRQPGPENYVHRTGYHAYASSGLVTRVEGRLITSCGLSLSRGLRRPYESSLPFLLLAPCTTRLLGCASRFNEMLSP